MDSVPFSRMDSIPLKERNSLKPLKWDSNPFIENDSIFGIKLDSTQNTQRYNIPTKQNDSIPVQRPDFTQTNQRNEISTNQNDSIPIHRTDSTQAARPDTILPNQNDSITSKRPDSIQTTQQNNIPPNQNDSIPISLTDSIQTTSKDTIPPLIQDSTQFTRQLDSSTIKQGKNYFNFGELSVPSERITIRDYKIISHERDTTYLDTTLTIQKEYKYNYLRRDNFELMPFANIGQPYNKLGVDLTSQNFYPTLGVSALSYSYLEVGDIDYYNVATPMSDLFFKTTFEEGQLLDATLTFNTSPRLNFSIAYKGFRSLGKYQFNQAESGHFRMTSNYATRDGRYRIRAHIAAQDIETEANGGLTNKEEQFESGDGDFDNRIKVDVRFGDANNKILGKRYYFDQIYKLLRTEKDSSAMAETELNIGHQFHYETKYYDYAQTVASPIFGDALVSTIADRSHLKSMYNQVHAEFYNATLGRLRGNLSLYNYNYFFNSTLITQDGQQIPSRLRGEEIAVGADYEKTIGGFEVEGSVKYNPSGDLGGNLLNASAGYRFNNRHSASVSAHASSRLPNFNYLLYQSDYRNYNWLNLSAFEKEQVYGLQFKFDSEIWGDLTVDYTTVDNYSYFGQDADASVVVNTEGETIRNDENANIRPLQESNVLNHTKIKYNKEFRLGSFALNNTVMYQNVSQANQVLNLPQLVTRNTLYFSSDVFKKAMFLQTGVTLKYFTRYTMDAYNPLLGEFYVQDAEELGGFPMLDFFINAKVQQTRIYFKAEHFNSGFSEPREYYSAPNYPYRDFVIRFGLVWNFFS